MEKTRIKQFVEKQIQNFQNPEYNPYAFEEEYAPGLKKLGFKAEIDSFIKRHPEINTGGGVDPNSEVCIKAMNAEQDILVLGNFILAYARDELRSAWAVSAIKPQRHIEPLKALLKLCE